MTDSYEEALKNISLQTQIKVANEMAFINLIVELGYRESKMWSHDEDELLSKLLGLANKHTEDILEKFNEHQKQ